MEFPFTELLNSNRGGGDKLNDAAWITGFLKRWGLKVGAPSAEDIERLKTLRQAMANIVDALTTGRGPDEDDMREVISALAGSHMTFALTAPAGEWQLSLQPVKKDWDWALHEIAASFAKVLSSEDKSRLKVCENAECGMVFYDESKSRTRRWCGSACGNLIKVREFRKRQKEKSEK
ncbi:MAG: CGNR zinc finger domain-containing protein [Burkholderiales bacterium]